MAAPTRSAMRLLSPRLQSAGPLQLSPILRQIRNASSRYSDPTKRSFVAALGQSSTSPEAAGEFRSNASEGNGRTRVPLDRRQENELRRQYHLRRMRFASMGLLLSIGATALVIYSLDLDDMDGAQREKQKQKQHGKTQLDASDEANKRFQGKEVHVVGAGEGKRIVAQGVGGDEVELVETGTSSVPHFPRTIYLPSSPEGDAGSEGGHVDSQEQYTLVGLGIRSVMWIQVYVVGLYVRTVDISMLQEKLIERVNPAASTLVPAEKEELQKKLLDPTTSREIWSELLRVPGMKTAWRVSPTRNTDFAHLRDGFVTGINKRVQEQRQLNKGEETEFDAEEFGQAVQQFKGVFAGGKAAKGSILLLLRNNAGGLNVLYQAKPEGKHQEIEQLGAVADERIARLIWLGYLGGDKVSSEAARKGVVEGCMGFASRPIGSVETMVT